MLVVCADINRFNEFKDLIKNDLQFIDLARVPSSTLADESDSIVSHHTNCVVFLGYLEPGWMLEPAHQTRLRKLFRKFTVGLVTHFVESIPYSWKNEISTFYISKPLNGISNSINDGGSLQD